MERKKIEQKPKKKKNTIENELRDELRKKLNKRHSHLGIRNQIDQNNHYILPYEKELNNRDAGYFSQLPAISLLSTIPLDENFSTTDLKAECDKFYHDPEMKSSQKGSYQNKKRTINRHIKSITGTSLEEWFSGKHKHIAYKTFYLLYQLNIIHKSGLTMLSKADSGKYAEVELFSAHTSTISTQQKTPKQYDLTVLNHWICELFVKCTYQLKNNEKWLLRNLDIFATGYNNVVEMLIRDESFGADFVEQHWLEIMPKFETPTIAAKSEPLNIALIKHWQKNTWVRQSDLRNESNLKQALRAAFNNKKTQTQRKSIPAVTLREAAKILSLSIWSAQSISEINTTFYDVLEKRTKAIHNEELIFKALKSDCERSVNLISKGLADDGTRTSLRSTLLDLVSNNQDILQHDYPIDTQHFMINLEGISELHYKYLINRCYKDIYYPQLSIDEYITQTSSHPGRIKRLQLITEMVSNNSIQELLKIMYRLEHNYKKWTGQEVVVITGPKVCVLNQ